MQGAKDDLIIGYVLLAFIAPTLVGLLVEGAYDFAQEQYMELRYRPATDTEADLILSATVNDSRDDGIDPAIHLITAQGTESYLIEP